MRVLNVGGGGADFRWTLQEDTLMAESILIERADRPTGDLLGELFKEGMDDPSSLPIHPCPPGKKDKTMRSDLMTFQVSRPSSKPTF